MTAVYAHPKGKPGAVLLGTCLGMKGHYVDPTKTRGPTSLNYVHLMKILGLRTCTLPLESLPRTPSMVTGFIWTDLMANLVPVCA